MPQKGHPGFESLLLRHWMLTRTPIRAILVGVRCISGSVVLRLGRPKRRPTHKADYFLVRENAVSPGPTASCCGSGGLCLRNTWLHQRVTPKPTNPTTAKLTARSSTPLVALEQRVQRNQPEKHDDDNVEPGEDLDENLFGPRRRMTVRNDEVDDDRDNGHDEQKRHHTRQTCEQTHVLSLLPQSSFECANQGAGNDFPLVSRPYYHERFSPAGR